jgi:O-methyltransferase involved in polyketide biosynthesis
VSFFLSDAAVRQTIADVADLCAPGSRFLWDYLHADVVAGTTRYAGARRARASVARRGEPYTFGLTRSTVTELLGEYGFGLGDHQTMTELAARYGGEKGVWCSTDDFFGIVTAVRRIGDR